MTNESPSSGREDNKALNTYGMAPQAWKDYFVTFEDLRRKVLNKIFSLERVEKDKLLQRIHQKQTLSFASVDEPWKYLTYHKSIGSSVGPIDAPNLDFKGENSLLKFYEEFDKEIS